MKSLVQVVNSTQETISIEGVSFEPGAPVMVYRNQNYFQTGPFLGQLITHLHSGDLVGYDFDGNANAADVSVAICNALNNELHRHVDSYSVEYHWRLDSCHAMLDGFKKQIDAFDFSGVDVTVDRAATMAKAMPALNMLSIGFLGDAKDELNATTPDTDNDFLSAATMAKFVALFTSASA